MFINRTKLIRDNPVQLNYGVAVVDVDGDGAMELFVAGYGAANLALKWDGRQFVDVADATLKSTQRQAIGVAAGDIDGDGREEIYVLNTDTFAGEKRFGDHLFNFQDGRWIDLFALHHNARVANYVAGRSVACVDREGNGVYGMLVANYGGPLRLYETLDGVHLVDIAPEAGLDYITGGRALLSLPLVSDRMDIFAANENSPNFLFVNRGDGKFDEMAEEYGVADPYEHARGVAALDADGNGRFDLVVGNWEGPHRLYLQSLTGGYMDAAPPEMAEPSRVRTVIAADFDNDGYEEIFFNNIGQPNRLFALRERDDGSSWQTGEWVGVDVGDALEPWGLGTGAAIGDFDGDGRLELLISHGEAQPQPLSLYHTPDNANDWLRVMPLTPRGAPARGAVVILTTRDRILRRAIDAGSGYLCQMEPVAHFGLGLGMQLERLEVRWPDGTSVTLDDPRAFPPRSTLRIPYPET
jgi:hypothetical protein